VTPTPEEVRSAVIGLQAFCDDPINSNLMFAVARAKAVLAAHAQQQAMLKELLGTAEAINGSLDHCEEQQRPWEDKQPEPLIFAKVREMLKP
jgi:hypothetical protein